MRKYQEMRGNILVTVVHLDGEECRYVPNSMPMQSAYFCTNSPSELFLDGAIFMTNVDRFQRDEELKINKMIRYLGKDANIVDYLNGSRQRFAFEELWKQSLSLYTYFYLGERVGIDKSGQVLDETVNSLVVALRGIDQERWATWERISFVTEDQFLNAVDEGFDRFLSASGEYLSVAKREEVELFWREMYPCKREIVSAFIEKMLPIDVTEKFHKPVLTFVPDDIARLFSLALVEECKVEIGGFVAGMDFGWKSESQFLLDKIDLILNSQECVFDQDLILGENIDRAIMEKVEVRIACKQITNIYTPRSNRGMVEQVLRRPINDVDVKEIILKMMRKNSHFALDLGGK